MRKCAAQGASRRAARGLPALADDSGIEVDALGGRPGVYSARYAGEAATDLQNLEKMLEELRDVPLERRTARYQCVIASLRKRATIREPLIARALGKVALLDDAAGTGGFGYDPIFQPRGPTPARSRACPRQEKNSRQSSRAGVAVPIESWSRTFVLRERHGSVAHRRFLFMSTCPGACGSAPIATSIRYAVRGQPSGGGVRRCAGARPGIRRAKYVVDRSCSIFFGGGTPSLFSAQAIGRVLEAARATPDGR